MQTSMRALRGSAFSGSRQQLNANGVRPARVSSRMVVEARQREAGVGIFGTKAGMMTYFTDDGLCVPATVIALEDGNVVTAIKTAETDGYAAVQVGYKVVAERKVTKPELGHLQKAGCSPMKHLREFRVRLPGKEGAAAACWGLGGHNRGSCRQPYPRNAVRTTRMAAMFAALERTCTNVLASSPAYDPMAARRRMASCRPRALRRQAISQPASCATDCNWRTPAAAWACVDVEQIAVAALLKHALPASSLRLHGLQCKPRSICAPTSSHPSSSHRSHTFNAIPSVLLQLVDSSKVGEFAPGQALDVAAMFPEGAKVDVAGTTVGKGFQGEWWCVCAVFGAQELWGQPEGRVHGYGCGCSG